MSHRIEVGCRAEGTRLVCSVVVGVDSGATHHEVTVSRDLLAELRPGAGAPDGLVRDSFTLLLEREPRESILRSFDLPLIGRYFAEWEAKIREPRAGS
ncbi:MAG: hypothetical protein WED12_02645 [Chloroflexota bacterium]